ncbi:MAG TPA: P1 family peptidase [Gemmatimonadaceae bacterium]|nr:P1 family peptidase [Gemmatimonadaceae bacterium]
MSERPDLARFGVAVGHATDAEGATGLTVVRGVSEPLRGGVAVVGRATGSRELLAISSDHLVDGRVDAIMLTGGSAYGLDAAAGVMRWMEERGRGFSIGRGVVPIVPGAVVFDLAPLGRFDARPTAEMAYAATESARSSGIAEGAVGAGTGTTVGKIGGPELAMKGGVGLAVEGDPSSGVAAFALAVVNAFGDVRDANGQIIAGARRAGGEGGFVDTLAALGRASTTAPSSFERLALRNTTLAVVGVNRAMPSVELTALARAATAAFYRRITPCGTAFDGDIVFAVAPAIGEPLGAAPAVAGVLAAAALEHAIERAVVLARGREGIPGIADTNGH